MPISTRLRHERSHIHSQMRANPLIHRKGCRKMSDYHQADVQLHSLTLKHSLSSITLNIILNHNHRRRNGNKYDIALGSKRRLQ